MVQQHSLDKRLKPVRDVTRGIRSLEGHCESVVTGAAQLAIDVIQASTACGLPATDAQTALERVSAIFQAGIQSRGLSVCAHQALLDAARNPSIPVSWGDTCPTTGEDRSLKLVG